MCQRLTFSIESRRAPLLVQQRFERATGIKHDDRHVMPAPGKPGGKHGELALAAADRQIADEKQDLHPGQ